MIDHDEPLDAQPLGDDVGHVPRPRRPLGRVVLRDRAAGDDAAVLAQRRERHLERRAADVVEVQVDALAQRLARVGLAVVERLVEPELLQPRDLLGRAGAADHAAALQLRDLPGEGADRARCTGDVDRLPRLRPADVEQPDLRRQAGHPEHAERRRDGRERRDRPASGRGRPRARARASRASSRPTIPRARARCATRRPGRRRRRSSPRRPGTAAGTT